MTEKIDEECLKECEELRKAIKKIQDPLKREIALRALVRLEQIIVTPPE